MHLAISHFREAAQISAVSTENFPIVLNILVAGEPQVGGVSAETVGSGISSGEFCEVGVGDAPAVLAQQSVSTQISTTRPSPSATRASDTVRQAPPVRAEVHYVHAPPIVPPYMGSGVIRSYEEYLPSEDEDESEYPLGYFDDSSGSCEEEEEQYGHLAAPHFSTERLEQELELDTGFQQNSYGGSFEAPLGEEFLPHNEFNVGTVSFENESTMNDESEYTAGEWAAREAGAHDSDGTGGAEFYDEDSYYEDDAGYDSSDDYY
ncbi:hypothetical protein CYMTET_23918 [Cymbomonas tetramitiformis]|uniref:Uncharacterized protein n=1 Tax=Cymbomonas tetramitiformis TaxID=36881 RepID=A0AAE0FXG1_9CHLO|nr:hypothetical protein CYMTET_23918 [Cymbomonas tetramitiformis]